MRNGIWRPHQERGNGAEEKEVKGTNEGEVWKGGGEGNLDRERRSSCCGIGFGFSRDGRIVDFSKWTPIRLII